MNPAIAPASDRLQSVDALRGVAVLGILLMNIIGFAFHHAVYGDPTIQGGASGINYWTFLINAVLVDGKMRGMFTILFGAGICLLTGRAEERGAGAGVADVYYRRTVWLLVFGALHAYLLWWGEVLYPYALLGLALYPFRRMSVRSLIALSALLTVLMTGQAYYDAAVGVREKAGWDAVEKLKKEGKTPTDEQEKDASGWEATLRNMKPSPRAIARNHAGNTDSFGSMVRLRSGLLGYYQRQAMYSPLLWDLLAPMLLGMALFKIGILTGERSTGFYLQMALISYLIGLPLHAVQLYTQTSGWFSVNATLWAATYYQFARTAVCLGHIAVFMLIFKHGVAPGCTRVLASVGQMALTNYVMQSVICTLIFNVLKLHGTMQRYQVYYIVLAIWAAQLCWSPLWLRRYRFGPLEWVWRSLTYWQRQPMRQPAPGVPAAERVGTVVN